ncbi:MAG: DNA/RNA non-specific endonuclease, partial [Psychroserpens sp.]|nr:DNA/RNA non-specific endonuclease [Psychroserpens sp.]
NDMFYRDIQIPESFWKVVITNTGNNEIHATGYMLSQKQWLDDIEFVFGAYRTYQIPISMIEEQTGFTFSKDVQESDPLFSDLESVFGSFSIHPLDSVNKIKF